MLCSYPTCVERAARVGAARHGLACFASRNAYPARRSSSSSLPARIDIVRSINFNTLIATSKGNTSAASVSCAARLNALSMNRWRAMEIHIAPTLSLIGRVSAMERPAQNNHPGQRRRKWLREMHCQSPADSNGSPGFRFSAGRPPETRATPLGPVVSHFGELQYLMA